MQTVSVAAGALAQGALMAVVRGHTRAAYATSDPGDRLPASSQGFAASTIGP